MNHVTMHIRYDIGPATGAAVLEMYSQTAVMSLMLVLVRRPPNNSHIQHFPHLHTSMHQFASPSCPHCCKVFLSMLANLAPYP